MAERYDIKGKLGRGGIGAIYRAFDTVMGRDVAIKRLLPIEQTHLNEAADESLQREAAALAKLSHPNILTIYAFEEDEDGPYVVTELIEGENLKETIERGALPLEDFEGIVEQTLEPLIGAHAEGLLHRDLKPANIMLTWLSTGKFQIKILDFGLSKFSQQPSLQTLDQTGSFLGSIDFIAPEQIELKPLDFRADLYSLGCVYYYALAQRPPFEDKSPALTMRRHLDHELTPIQELRADLPGPIADWVMRMISLKPDDRPSSASEALEEFGDARKGISPLPVAAVPLPEPDAAAPVTAGPTGPVTPSGKTLLTGPVNIAGAATGAQDPAQVAATGPVTATGKTLLTGDAAARQPTQPRRSPGKRTTATKTALKRKTSEKSLKGPIIALVSALVISAIVLPIVFNKDSGDGDGDGDGSGDGRATASNGQGSGAAAENKGGKNKSKSASGGGAAPPLPAGVSPAMAHVEKLPPKLPKARAGSPPAPLPPVGDGLVGHYEAGARTFREDFKTRAEPGDAVAAWANLASDQPFHYLARLNDRRDQIPALVKGDRNKFPALNASHPLVRFNGNNGLRVRPDGQKSIGINQQQLSFFVVCRADEPNGHIIKFDGKNKRWSFMTAIAQQKGYSLKTRKDEGKGHTQAVQNAPLQQFMIYSARWDGVAGKQVLRITATSGQRKVTEEVDVKTKPVDLFGYMVGTPNKSDAGANAARFSGYIGTILIYSRCLDDAEFVQVEDHLVDRYFKKGS